jgi:hypothetical protein
VQCKEECLLCAITGIRNPDTSTGKPAHGTLLEPIRKVIVLMVAAPESEGCSISSSRRRSSPLLGSLGSALAGGSLAGRGDRERYRYIQLHDADKDLLDLAADYYARASVVEFSHVTHACTSRLGRPNMHRLTHPNATALSVANDIFIFEA